MSSQSELEQRLVDLEMRVAFQEQALTELSDALAGAREDEGRNALLLHRVLEELKQMRMVMSTNPITGDASQEPPPPHY